MHSSRWKFVAAAVLALPVLRCAGATPAGQCRGPAPRAAAARSRALCHAGRCRGGPARARRPAGRSTQASCRRPRGASDPGDAGARGRRLGRIGDDRGAALLRSLLADRSSGVRAMAAFGCQLLGTRA